MKISIEIVYKGEHTAFCGKANTVCVIWILKQMNNLSPCPHKRVVYDTSQKTTVFKTFFDVFIKCITAVNALWILFNWILAFLLFSYLMAYSDAPYVAVSVIIIINFVLTVINIFILLYNNCHDARGAALYLSLCSEVHYLCRVDDMVLRCIILISRLMINYYSRTSVILNN